MPPPDLPLWHADGSELQALEKQKCGGRLPLSFPYPPKDKPSTERTQLSKILPKAFHNQGV